MGWSDVSLANLCSVSLCWKTSKRSRTEPFCAAELRRALKEQAFAIKRFRITPAPPHEARASIVLLEGKAINIQLTMQGYIITHQSNSEFVYYETLEDLLRAVSPLYTAKQQEAIIKALSRLT